MLDTFNRLKKWREEQIQEFRSRQLQESQKFSNESKKNFERVLEIASMIYMFTYFCNNIRSREKYKPHIL